MLTGKQQVVHDMFLEMIEQYHNYFLSSHERNIGKTYTLNELGLTLQALGYRVFVLTPYLHTEYFADRFISLNENDFRGRFGSNEKCVVLADEERYGMMYDFIDYCDYRKVPIVGYINFN